MNRIINNLKSQIVPLFFSIICTYWTMTLYFGAPAVGTLLTAIIMHCFYFICFTKLRWIKRVGGVYYIAFSTVYMFITVMILSAASDSYKINFFAWISYLQLDGTFRIGFWLGILLFLTYFFSSTVYYFGIIRFRMPIILLTAMLPLSVHTLRANNEINLLFLLFVMAFFIMFVERTRVKVDSRKVVNKIDYFSYLQAISIFAVISIMLSSFIPRTNRLPKIDSLDSALLSTFRPLGVLAQSAMSGGRNGLSIFDPVRLRGSSDINAISAPQGDRVLFEVNASEPLYFRIQSFDKYYNNRWLIGNKELETGHLLSNSNLLTEKFNSIVNSMAQLRNSDELKNTFSDLDGIMQRVSVPQTKKKAVVTTKGYQMESFLNPPGITMLTRYNKKGNVYLTDSACCFLGNNLNPTANEVYSIDYLSQSIGDNTLQDSIMKYMNKDRFGLFANFIYRQADNKTISYKDKSLIKEAQEDMNKAYENYTKLPDNIPQRVLDLARELTKDKVSDYDKAEAIENFFYTSGFKYDFNTPLVNDGREYNDFFIFDSKRGVCVQFASAMVVLARAAGLPARYTEGFVADEKDVESGNYVIREKNAHAFPEIFIAGYGWRTFEPTVAVEESGGSAGTTIKNIFNGIKNFIAGISAFFQRIPLFMKVIFIPAAAISCFLIVKLWISVRKRFWYRRIIKIDKGKALGLIFSKIEKMLTKIKKGRELYETPQGYALRIDMEVGAGIGELAEMYNKWKYGGVEPDSEEVRKALGIYDKVQLTVREKLGKFKAWTT